MLKLQWLQINKFRSVKPGTRLVFNPTFNVLLGQNGTGKTTLLNLVTAVVSSNFTALRDEDFEVEYELSSNVGKLVASVRNTRGADAQPFQSLMIHRGEKFRATEFLAQVKLFSPDGRLEFAIASDGARLTRSTGDETSAPVWRSFPSMGARLWATLLMGVVEWAYENYDEKKAAAVVGGYSALWSEADLSRFDEALGYFEQLKKTRFSLRRSKESGELQAWGTDVPEVLTKEWLRLAQPHWEAERYAFSSERVPFLSEAARLLGFEAIEASIELQQSKNDEDSDILEFGDLKFLLARKSGNRISEQHLSYGQKRILAFMYYLAVTRSVVVADELVNGLHHGWIRACIESLGSRQVFLTSQNPLLLDYLTFDSAEQVRSTFVLSRWEEAESGGQMVWEDMSLEAAEDFFASYKVGFQQVGELLQSKGLW
ncbi:MAG TPA: AAA family ATPase [Myxococcus sp.]|nr:AAA family ATPase [Myxococcus sp.]